MRVADIAFDDKRHTFALVANRFAWDVSPANERRRSGLHFGGVLAARRKGFVQSSPDLILSLLSVTFLETAAPAGKVTMSFSAGHTIELDVECIDCALRDLGPAWATGIRPQHDT